MLQKLTTPVIFLILLAAFNLLAVVPANIVTAVVIIKNKEFLNKLNIMLNIIRLFNMYSYDYYFGAHDGFVGYTQMCPLDILGNDYPLSPTAVWTVLPLGGQH